MTTLADRRGVPVPSRVPIDVARLFARGADPTRTAGLPEHLARVGPLPLAAYPNRPGRDRLIETIARAGLRGRGGAGFPTAEKLAAVAAAKGRTVVVANGCEGDPTSAKDQALLARSPHLVLDGIAIAAHAVDAREAMLCVHRGSPLVDLLHAALDERTDDRVPVEIVEVPDRYVASEASALVNFLTTGTAKPTTLRASERGVKGRPTLVDNVETLAHIALVARFGGDWFREAGTPESPGTLLVTVGGGVTRPGVYEVEAGLPLSDALELAGGEAEALQAVQIGGLGGSWLPVEDALELPLAHETCQDVGIPLGVAALVALPARACGIAETARVLAHLADESAGQCGPCMFGLPAIADDMAALSMGDGAVLGRLRSRLGVIPGRGACSHPDGAGRLAVTALHSFAADVAAHANGRPCAAAEGPFWTPIGVRP
ncbi:NADH-ubiquinone oxidoreductase-F iron-sulfur binding region domain-containing protein [Pseudonocardia sp.]|jgi:NADH:ubiquinone oxidoreductase subunit F (NADH-binding)|uniref:NADH-ubiquinone oxidoreductase-F iron-sulfur binding region domain-containing protein n=1 Tax=Pseudonocardia sp. TaxID=60912 RepID=UPI002639900A|nr:NADH-ubiquinone oxidoreductase-F iron-sulfur binding region domain-containing protein [Pseudonocardia sp.]MCW2722958.1 dehydrogenase [Pseudonocardia sp.]